MTTDLLAFLKARLDEDEQYCRELVDFLGADTGSNLPTHPWRVLVDIQAKRGVLASMGPELDAGSGLIEPDGLRRWAVAFAALRYLALSYADHPAYREEWKP